MKTMEERILELLDKVNQTHGITFAALAENGQIADEKALEHKEFFEAWAFPVDYQGGQVRQYDGLLYRIGQEHTSQEAYTPDISPALYTVIDKAHSGTIEDPIPAVANMEYVKGLYYVEDGVIYLMNREGMADGEAITLAHLPSQLIGHYFEVVG